MSGTSRKTGRRLTAQKRATRDLGDVTLNDFANCSISCGKGRLKKGASNNVVRKVKELNGESDSRAWYEKLEDFEDESEDESELGVKKTPRRREKAVAIGSPCKHNEGNDYPLDIWFLISEYIQPEDIGTFACLCKDSYHVVTTAKFWFHLYKRYYKTVPGLPECLEPESMVRLYGLRTSVIRALHYMYPPFVNRQRHLKEVSPHSLTKRQCELMWYQKLKNQWTFYFKLKHATQPLGRGTGTKSRQPDLIEMLEDVSANQEEGCKVLQVTSLNFISLPPVLGLTLQHVAMTLSHGLRSYCLRLEFGLGSLCYPANNKVVIFDPVMNINILDWWHPLYPHANGFGIYLEHGQSTQDDSE